MISNLDGGRQPNRVEPVDVFRFRCSLQSTLYFVCLVVISVSGAIYICDKLVKVVVHPIIFSEISVGIYHMIHKGTRSVMLTVLD